MTETYAPMMRALVVAALALATATLMLVALNTARAAGALVVVPSIEGRRGNPVVWSRRFFHDLMSIQGDIGARHLIGNYAEAVVEVPVAGEAALTDVDTPESLLAVKAEIERA